MSFEFGNRYGTGELFGSYRPDREAEKRHRRSRHVDMLMATEELMSLQGRKAPRPKPEKPKKGYAMVDGHVFRKRSTAAKAVGVSEGWLEIRLRHGATEVNGHKVERLEQ